MFWGSSETKCSKKLCHTCYCLHLLKFYITLLKIKWWISLRSSTGTLQEIKGKSQSTTILAHVVNWMVATFSLPIFTYIYKEMLKIGRWLKSSLNSRLLNTIPLSSYVIRYLVFSKSNDIERHGLSCCAFQYQLKNVIFLYKQMLLQKFWNFIFIFIKNAKVFNYVESFL